MNGEEPDRLGYLVGAVMVTLVFGVPFIYHMMTRPRTDEETDRASSCSGLLGTLGVAVGFVMFCAVVYLIRVGGGK